MSRENFGYKFVSNDRKFIYHISIIDYLQLYDLNKFLETSWKTGLCCKMVPKNEISSIDYEPYGNRFLSYMKN
jgi:hypothetical protein